MFGLFDFNPLIAFNSDRQFQDSGNKDRLIRMRCSRQTQQPAGKKFCRRRRYHALTDPVSHEKESEALRYWTHPYDAEKFVTMAQIARPALPEVEIESSDLTRAESQWQQSVTGRNNDADTDSYWLAQYKNAMQRCENLRRQNEE